MDYYKALILGIIEGLVNLDTENDATNISLTPPQYFGEKETKLYLEFTTLDWGTDTDNTLTVKDLKFEIENIKAGEGRIYRK